MSSFGVGNVSPLWLAGFIGNPFRSLTEEEWGELALLPPAVAVLHQSPAIHLQIMGASGIGKSSALRAVLREARSARAEAILEYLPLGISAFQTNPKPYSLFCLDEAQRLNAQERQRLLAIAHERGIRLCLGTHEDFTPLMEKAGLAIKTIALGDRSADEYTAVWNSRLTYFARPEVAHATLSPASIAALHHRFGNDLRAAERFLYQYFQKNISAPREITEVDLAGALAFAG